MALSGPLFWRAAYAEPAQPGPGPYGPLDGIEPDANGVVVPKGFSVRILATAGEVVAGTDYLWHTFPDGGACFAQDDGGWIYASNSEVGADDSGVGALRFDDQGEVVDAYRLLSGTGRNCGGGPTPWGTWLSGEEVPDGLVWECDPTTADSGEARPALGTFNHEAVAVDADGEALYLTEDMPDGRLYRFVPDAYPNLDAGELSVAVVADDDAVTWEPVPDPAGTTTPTRLQGTGTVFTGGEGIWCEDQTVFFTTKGDNKVWALDIVESTLEILYDAALIADAPLTGVDNVTRSASGDLFVCEDGGTMELVIISPEREVAPFCQFTGQDGSELAGVAFSPDESRLYVSSQRGGSEGIGTTYEITGPFRAPVQQPAATTTTLAGLEAGPEGRGTDEDTSDGDDDGSSLALVAGGIGVVAGAVAVGAAVVVRRRRSTGHDGSAPTDQEQSEGLGTSHGDH